MNINLERTYFQIDRQAEYFDKRELKIQTGQGHEEFGEVILKELIDNSLDACESTGILNSVISMTESFMTSEEIGHLTQTAHEFVLERASEQLLRSGINPNDFWSEYTDLITGELKKRLHLPKRECLLAIGDPWYSDKAIGEVLKVWNTWDLEHEE